MVYLGKTFGDLLARGKRSFKKNKVLATKFWNVSPSEHLTSVTLSTEVSGATLSAALGAVFPPCSRLYQYIRSARF